MDFLMRLATLAMILCIAVGVSNLAFRVRDHGFFLLTGLVLLVLIVIAATNWPLGEDPRP